jgi:hypothetical protein
MTARSITTRIEKLEARRRNDDEMLMLWRKPGSGIDAAVLSANKAGLFGSGDLVLCGEWYGEGDPPPPRWVQRIKRDLTAPEMESLHQTLRNRTAASADDAKATSLADAPPYLCTWSDEALWSAVLGVRT